MNISDLIDRVADMIETHISNEAEQVKPHQLRLDNRAGWRLYVNEKAIAVDKDNDRSLQYYGGFEYVDKEYRVELGNYVFYLVEDSRVAEHIEYFYENDGYVEP